MFETVISSVSPSVLIPSSEPCSHETVSQTEGITSIAISVV